MLKPYEPSDDADPVVPECRATVAQIQRALDGEVAPESLDADPHLGACAACRERLRAARVLLSVLAIPSEPVPVPEGFTDRVVQAVLDDKPVPRWGADQRRRIYKRLAASVAIAAAIVLVVDALIPRIETRNGTFDHVGIVTKVVGPPEVAPAPREKPQPAPDPRPMHVRDEVAKAGQVFRDAPKPIADSVAVAPKLLDAFAGAFTKPAGPVAPMGDLLEPTRKSLSDLPDAARHGFEPVTGTAQKAFDRLLRDVAAVKPKPNS